MTVMYHPHLDWPRELGGSTVFYDVVPANLDGPGVRPVTETFFKGVDETEAHLRVLPTPRRIIFFDSRLAYAAGPVKDQKMPMKNAAQLKRLEQDRASKKQKRKPKMSDAPSHRFALTMQYMCKRKGKRFVKTDL